MILIFIFNNIRSIINFAEQQNKFIAWDRNSFRFNLRLGKYSLYLYTFISVTESNKKDEMAKFNGWGGRNTCIDWFASFELWRESDVTDYLHWGRRKKKYLIKCLNLEGKEKKNFRKTLRINKTLNYREKNITITMQNNRKIRHENEWFTMNCQK